MAVPAISAQADVDFVAFGDMPYTPDQVTMMKKLAHDPALEGSAFTIFYGDTKSGGARCTLKTLKLGKALMDGMLDVPVFFTPGDNDWTDCDRKGDDEYKVLDELLMPLYFSDDALPENRFETAKAWDVTRQDGQIENARWTAGGVTFATFHIIATGNGRAELKIGDPATMLDRVDARDAHNLAWLEETFAAAAGAEALTLVMHTDPTVVPDSLPVCDKTQRTDCDPYKPFLDTLRDKATAFGKPVLLIHGDTSPYCVEDTYLGVPNMRRLNATGDYAPGVTRVHYGNGGFSFTPVGHNRGPEDSCPAKDE